MPVLDIFTSVTVTVNPKGRDTEIYMIILHKKFFRRYN